MPKVRVPKASPMTGVYPPVKPYYVPLVGGIYKTADVAKANRPDHKAPVANKAPAGKPVKKGKK